MHTALKNSSSIADVQPNSKNMVRFGVIGYGYWGPNVVRNLTSLEGSELMAVCDKSPAARRRLQKAHPGIAVATEASEILASADLVCRLLLEKKNLPKHIFLRMARLFKCTTHFLLSYSCRLRCLCLFSR